MRGSSAMSTGLPQARHHELSVLMLGLGSDQERARTDVTRNVRLQKSLTRSRASCTSPASIKKPAPANVRRTRAGSVVRRR